MVIRTRWSARRAIRYLWPRRWGSRSRGGAGRRASTPDQAL